MAIGIIFALGTFTVETKFPRKQKPKFENYPKKNIKRLEALLSELDEVLIRRNIDKSNFQSIVEDIRLKITNRSISNQN